MDNQTKELIEQFKAYRDLLSPVQKNLSDFVATYDTMKESIDKLNNSFGDDLKVRLEGLFEKMSTEAHKAAQLAMRIDLLSSSTEKYAASIDSIAGQFARVERRLSAMSEVDRKVNEQLERIEKVIDEKSKVYNLSQLQAALDGYNRDIKKVGEFLNKDVAEVLLESKEKIDAVKKGLGSVVEGQKSESGQLSELIKQHEASAGFLRKIVESQDINEAYLFEVLDRWAAARKIKTKN